MLELTRCMYTQMPGDQDLLVGAYRASMLPASHHFNMFYAEPTNPYLADKPLDELTSCDDGFKSYLAGSQWTEVDEVIPNGLYVRVPAGSILVLESHYVNTGDEAVPARVVRLAGQCPTDTDAHPLALGLWNDPVHVGPGKSLEWACNYRNTTFDPVVGGGSAETDEMCIMAAFYYPKKSAQPYCFDSPTATPLP